MDIVNESISVFAYHTMLYNLLNNKHGLCKGLHWPTLFDSCYGTIFLYLEAHI